MNKDEVQKLAKLSRIDIGDAEAEKLSNEFGKILDYVAEVKKAVSGDIELSKNDLPLRNVMREDTEPYEIGIYTEKLLAEAPKTKDGFVAVKKIL